MSASIHRLTNADYKTLATAELKKTLTEEISKSEDPINAFNRYAETISLDQLQEAVQIDYPQFTDILTTAKGMFQEAQSYLQAADTQITPALKTRLQNLLDGIVKAIESIINAFGIASLFSPAESELHSDMKGQKLMMLLSLFSILSATLIPVLGPALGGMIIGGALLGIAALSLIYPLIKAAPSELPKGVNWTMQFQKGQLSVVEGRKKTLDEIAEALITNKKVKTHPLLLGKTGVGKTETVKSLVKAIERGDYPELKGKKVIYFNVADLVTNSEMFSYGNRILERISEAIGKYREDYILVFDEIHLACQSKDYTDIGNQLKTLLDSGTQNFPYSIGITTEEDYYRDIYLNHAAFARRFKRINVENTDRQETIDILNNAFLQQAPKSIIANNDLGAFHDQVEKEYPGSPEPATSLRILSKCVQRTAETQKTPLEKRIEALREQIHSFYLQHAVGHGTSLLPYCDPQSVAKWESALADLEKEFKLQKEEMDRFFQLRDTLAAGKKKMFQTVQKILSKAPSIKQQKEFLFISHFLLPALEDRVKKESERLNMRTVIDSALVAQVIREEKETDLKARQVIEQGKKQLLERA